MSQAKEKPTHAVIWDGEAFAWFANAWEAEEYIKKVWNGSSRYRVVELDNPGTTD